MSAVGEEWGVSLFSEFATVNTGVGGWGGSEQKPKAFVLVLLAKAKRTSQSEIGKIAQEITGEKFSPPKDRTSRITMF